MTERSAGPLAGVRVVEVAGIGPGPFCGMLLADLGADVVRVDRPVEGAAPVPGVLGRGRRSLVVDLKHPDGAGVVLDLVAAADALIEGFRPGVAERLGIGPDACLARNPRLVYGRMTGWGQEGPMREAAGHDIDYIALAGALHPIGPPDQPPSPPLNLIGDFGGGGMLLAFGLVAALLEARSSGRGQVVDAAMVDGAALLTTMFHEMVAAGSWTDTRGANLLDGGAPFYTVYEAADGGYVAVGALEPQFYAELVTRLGLDPGELPDRNDRAHWPELRERFAAAFRTRTRDAWSEVFAGSDACVAPVLTLREAPEHPHNRARSTFVEVAPACGGGDGSETEASAQAGSGARPVRQPAPAPRFSRTPCTRPRPAPVPGQHTDEVLTEWGLAPERVAKLRAAGAIR